MSNSTMADVFEDSNDSNSSNSTAANATSDIPTVQSIDDGIAYGYQCAKVVQDNQLTDIPVTLFLDLAYPVGSEAMALTYVQEELIEAVATYYGISNGRRCADPAWDGSTWLVQILSKTSDWIQDPLADSCRELQPDPSTHDCHVYQATLTGSVLDGTMNDVLSYMELTLLNEDFAINSPYDVQFLAVADSDPTMGDSGRDNLGAPSNLNEQDPNLRIADSNSRQTITIVGGFLVAAFCIAFCGIGFVLWRRRKQWIVQRNLHLDALDLNDKVHLRGAGGTHPSDGEDEYISPETVLQDLYGSHVTQRGNSHHIHHDSHQLSSQDDNDVDHIEIDSHGNIRRGSNDEGTDADSMEDDNGGSDRHRGPDGGGSGAKNPHGGRSSFSKNNIHFDLGTSFKDQLMGVYGGSSSKASSARGGGGGGGRHQMGGLYGLGARGSDGASDSDADSWAQTDGTIGSLELQLEPITAEV